MSLLDEVNDEFRRLYLDMAKRQCWSGWEDAGLDKVEHLNVHDEMVQRIGMKLVALVNAIERRLQALELENERAERAMDDFLRQTKELGL